MIHTVRHIFASGSTSVSPICIDSVVCNTNILEMKLLVNEYFGQWEPVRFGMKIGARTLFMVYMYAVPVAILLLVPCSNIGAIFRN